MLGIQRLRKNLIQRIDKAEPGRKLVHSSVLITIRYPMIGDAGDSQRFAKIGTDFAAAFSMLDPETADGFVGVCQCKIIICQPVAEVGGVEVQADPMGPGVVHPTAKVCGLNGIAVYKASV